MREIGLSKENIEKILEDKISNDCDFNSGYILGSMCTMPLEIARKTYAKYLHINAGDRGISPRTADLEAELISQMVQLFHGDNIGGSLTSGGTESNIIAMRMARKFKPDIKHPEIIVSEEAHLSFEKLADLLGVKIVKAALKEDYRLNMDEVRNKINENTCGIMGIAGTTGLGLVDPIEELGALALENDLYLHIDAAFGGFILPFVKDLGKLIPKWDFSVEGVNSISADPHKMGMGVIPGGSFLIRNDEKLKELSFEIPYLAGGAFRHFNLLGTRPGATIISFWAALNSLGKKGYVQVVNECLKNTKYLANLINEMDKVKLVIDPPLNVVAIKMEDNSKISNLNKKLKHKGWLLGEFKKLNFLRVVCMPHVKKEHLERFCRDLESILKDI